MIEDFFDEVMDGYTESILSKFSDDVDEIDVSGCQIIGIVDLSRFTNLIKFSCNKNEITSIKGFASSLEYLNCSGNFIETLDLSFTNIIYCLAEDNQLKILKLPNKFIHEVHCAFNDLQTIDNFPDNIMFLDCSKNNIKKIDKFPSELITIIISYNPIEYLPEHFPNNIQTINCDFTKIGFINYLPPSLRWFYCHNSLINKKHESRLTRKYKWVRFFI